jgi:SIR2-like domain
MTPDLSKLSDLPALKQLARALWHNGSIRGAALMVGAGFSKYAIRQAPDTQEPPSWNELLDQLVDQLYPTDRSSAPRDALRIAEEYSSYFGQATLDGFIRTRFPDRAWLPGPLHLQALNFPWSDILTTNWETLLERTADEVTDFIYEIVRTEADIAHARSPRIIKLHGTLGDKDPLIFAAENYRTYPIRHAAFVNLARQIFIEMTFACSAFLAMIRIFWSGLAGFETTLAVMHAGYTWPVISISPHRCAGILKPTISPLSI